MQKNNGYFVKTFVTHTAVHPDEVGVHFLTEWGGEDMYPGIENARLQFVDAGSEAAVRPKDWASRGILPVGVWGSEFDEHGLKDDHVSAILLAARRYGIVDHPDVAHIVSYINGVDTGGGAKKHDLGSVLKFVHQLEDVSDVDAFEWCRTGIIAKVGDIVDPKNFSVDYIKELLVSQFSAEIAENWYAVAERGKEIQAILNKEAREIIQPLKKKGRKIPGTQKYSLTLETANTQVPVIAFSYFGCADVLVLKNPDTGHVAILTRKMDDPKDTINLTRVAAVLNMREFLAYVNTLKTVSKRARAIQSFRGHIAEVTKEGSMRFGRWANYRQGMWLLNGSASAPGVRPTRLSRHEVSDIVTDYARLGAVEIEKKNLHRIFTALIYAYCKDATVVMKNIASSNNKSLPQRRGNKSFRNNTLGKAFKRVASA